MILTQIRTPWLYLPGEKSHWQSSMLQELLLQLLINLDFGLTPYQQAKACPWNISLYSFSQVGVGFGYGSRTCCHLFPLLAHSQPYHALPLPFLCPWMPPCIPLHHPGLTWNSRQRSSDLCPALTQHRIIKCQTVLQACLTAPLSHAQMQLDQALNLKWLTNKTLTEKFHGTEKILTDNFKARMETF